MQTFSRRHLLKQWVKIGLAAAAYHPLVTSGLFRLPSAVAQELPHWPEDYGKGRKVAVVGVGIAGLTAAYELTRAGFEVTVFEAASHYGGRSLTVRPADAAYRNWYLDHNPFVKADSYQDSIAAEARGAKNPEQLCAFEPVRASKDGYFELYLNAGPGRIPTHHTGILHYCRQFGVPMEPYIFVSEANRMQAEGLNGGAPVQIRQFGYNMQAYLSEMLYQLSEAAIPGPSPQRQQAVEMFKEFLIEYGDLTADGQFQATSRAGYVREPGAGTNAGVKRRPLAFEEILEAKSMWPGLIDSDAYEWQASLLQPHGGMDMIWQAFLAQQTPQGKELRDLVQRNREVTGMSYNEPGADKPLRVTYRASDGGAYGQEKVEDVDYVIVTCLPYYTARMNLHDILAPTVREHLGSILYMPGGKYGWQAKTRFWEEADTQIFGGISWTSHQIEQIWYPSDGYNGPTGVLTGGYLHDKNPVDAWGQVYTAATGYLKPFEPTQIPPAERNASRWAQMPHRQRTEQALLGGNALHQGFSQKVYGDQGLSVSWDNQPFQFGIGAADMSTTRPDAYKRLIYAIDQQERVFLAGDYLSYWTGWQEGAVRSAWWTLGLLKNRILSQ